jgi:hypothetical protein
MSDNKLDHDLSAWEVPQPPSGLADAVLARMDGTDVVPAVPGEPRTPARRTMLIAGVAAACLAAVAGIYALVRSSQPVGSASGGVIATSPRALDLGGVTAELEQGADVRWQRHGSVLNVDQRAGSVAWRVDRDVQLLIDAGVTVASVDATGASLRVEVQMSSMDARVVGASALTAAAVSLVAVTVYTGHVKVRDGGQTVVVAPGTSYSVTPVRPPPSTPDLVGAAPVTFAAGPTIADVRIPAGESANVHVPSMPAMIEIDPGTACPRGVELYADGARQSGMTLALDAGAHGYAIRCAGDTRNVTAGMLVVVLDDGRLIAGAGTAGGPLATIVDPATTGSWADPLQVSGTIHTTAQASISGIALALTNDGRFSARVPRPASGKLALRLQRPSRDVDYFVVRQGPDSTTVAASCDEVSCVLDNYQGACCAKFKQPASPALAETLDRAAIARVMDSLEPQIKACGDQAPAESGKIVIDAKVNAAGVVTQQSSSEAYSPEVGLCVSEVVRLAQFPATKKGGAFSYPFNFQASSTVEVATGNTGLTREQISKAVARARADIVRCAESSSLSGTVKVRVVVRPDGKVSALSATETYDNTVSGCILDVMKKLRFPATADGGAFSYPFVMRNPFVTRSPSPASGPTPTRVASAACDADALKDEGMELINRGEWAMALVKIEASLACKSDPYVVQLAFMAACSAKNAAKARHYYPKLSPAQQTKFAQVCTRNGVDYQASSCDAEKTKEKGMQAVNMGQHVAALAQFEQSLACKFDPYVLQLAYMESCSSRNDAKARHYYPRLTPAQQSKLLPICTRNGLDPSKPACDADALKDRGIENISMGQHAAAAVTLEAAHRCKPDPTLPLMITVQHCASANAAKAKTWFAGLPKDQRARAIEECAKESISLDAATAPAASRGYLVVRSKPTGMKVLVDGVDTGLTTPIAGKALPVLAGRRRVTFVQTATGERFTYAVSVPSGGSVTLDKNLE